MCFIFSLSSVRYPVLTAAYLEFLYYLWISVSWEYPSGGRERINSLTFEVHLSHWRLQGMTHSRWSTWLMSGSPEHFLLPELSWECGREHYAPGPPTTCTQPSDHDFSFMRTKTWMPHVIPGLFQFCCKRFMASRNLKTLSGTSGSFQFTCLSFLKHHWAYSFDFHPKLAVLKIYLNMLLGDFKIKSRGLL